MNPLKKILIDRLKKKGIHPHNLPIYIRNLATTISADSQTNLWRIKKQMHFLGWDDVDLDYRTMELAAVCFETDDFDLSENRATDGFEINHQALYAMAG